MKTIRVFHVSTAHPAQDPRIVFKQCPTLAEQYEVYCALPHADSACSESIHFIRLPYFRRVIWRALFTSPYALIRGLWLRPQLVHVYVPEFLPFAFVFQLLGANVIYEVQENLYKKMYVKTLNRGRLLEKAFYKIDQFARKHCYLIFTEHAYLTTYTSLTKPYEVIYNYPLPGFLEPFRTPYYPSPTKPSFFYIGLLSFERAFDTLVDALAQLKATYPEFVVHLFGSRTFTDDDLARLPRFNEVKANLRFYGYTDQREAFRYAAGATAGLALLKPVGDYPDSYTTKLFEYMALGLPVITSDFPLYKQVVEQHQCGFCVSPNNPAEIADALRYLIEHPKEALAMGLRGYEAVKKHYTWTTEARKLLSFYERVLNS
ncbi:MULTISPECIES: glycosyltransferase [unclassified Spirosoma]|uniref:glycosyltransferase family 4 protein n=1 Tax=unclassified Spirosoma TaxID=2621999 RepID=UPI00096650F7|nr:MULTISPECIES: glycosyltransferase [unclassified Spirosoma]MBN8824115.1 glycosyltransferase [Spirosoma sp.]OJW78859.1 MAG: glycosyl transferase family 1 [Spirosoma sp. 48-14]